MDFRNIRKPFPASNYFQLHRPFGFVKEAAILDVMRKRNSSSDLTFVCHARSGIASTVPKRINAHRAIFAGVSVLVKNLIKMANETQAYEAMCISIEDTEPIIIDKLIQYIYTGNTTVNTQQQVQLIELCNHLQIILPFKHCYNPISTTPTNVFTLDEMAPDMPSMKKIAPNNISSPVVTEVPNGKKLPPESLTIKPISKANTNNGQKKFAAPVQINLENTTGQMVSGLSMNSATINTQMNQGPNMSTGQPQRANTILAQQNQENWAQQQLQLASPGGQVANESGQVGMQTRMGAPQIQGQGVQQQNPHKSGVTQQSFDELLAVLRSPNSEGQRQQVLEILKSSPSLMAAFIKQRHIQNQNDLAQNVQNCSGTSAQVQVDPEQQVVTTTRPIQADGEPSGMMPAAVAGNIQSKPQLSKVNGNSVVICNSWPNWKEMMEEEKLTVNSVGPSNGLSCDKNFVSSDNGKKDTETSGKRIQSFDCIEIEKDDALFTASALPVTMNHVKHPNRSIRHKDTPHIERTNKKKVHGETQHSATCQNEQSKMKLKPLQTLLDPLHVNKMLQMAKSKVQITNTKHRNKIQGNLQFKSAIKPMHIRGNLKIKIKRSQMGQNYKIASKIKKKNQLQIPQWNEIQEVLVKQKSGSGNKLLNGEAENVKTTRPLCLSSWKENPQIEVDQVHSVTTKSLVSNPITDNIMRIGSKKITTKRRPQIKMIQTLQSKKRQVKKTRPEQSGLYCVCRKSYNKDQGIMIGCDFCDEWFHPSCLMLSNEETINLIDTRWKCPLCDSKDVVEDVINSYEK